MQNLESRVDALEDAHHGLHGRVTTLEQATSKLQEDLIQIQAAIPTLATKIDIAQGEQRINSHVDSVVNGVLRDALNAVPWRYAGVTLGTMVTIVGLVLTFMHLATH